VLELIHRAVSSGSEFLQQEDGQDMIEYSLLLASVALAGAAAYIGMIPLTKGLWMIANSRLANANN